MAWRNKANTLNDMKRYSEALQAAEQALSLQPQNAIGWKRKAAALRGLGRTKEEAEARA
jgi:tetratricopeptide (TPR) repeat protein